MSERIVNKIWHWQTEKLRSVIYRQCVELDDQLNGTAMPRIKCGLCSLTARLDRIYKCRQCGLMLCPVCSLDHFNLKQGRGGKVYPRWAIWRLFRF